MTDRDRQLVLTPECQTLWVLEPTQLFVHDSVVIDRRDYESLLNPTTDSRLNAWKARAVERLVEFGYVDIRDYGSVLPPQTRALIREKATAQVKRLAAAPDAERPGSDFLQLSHHAHREYLVYLEQSIIAAGPTDTANLAALASRADRVQARIAAILDGSLADSALEELQTTLERVAAKALAGVLVSHGLGVGRLYDTREYLPFIQGLLAADTDDIVEYAVTGSVPGFDLVVGVLATTERPTVRDRREFFEVLESREEFESLKAAVARLDEFLAELVEVRPDLARDWVRTELQAVNKRVRDEVDRLLTRPSSRFARRLGDVAVSTVAGWGAPLLEEAKRLNRKQLREHVLQELKLDSRLQAGLAYVSDLWERPSPAALNDLRSGSSTVSETALWGDQGASLPWYEVDELDAGDLDEVGEY